MSEADEPELKVRMCQVMMGTPPPGADWTKETVTDELRERDWFGPHGSRDPAVLEMVVATLLFKHEALFRRLQPLRRNNNVYVLTDRCRLHMVAMGLSTRILPPGRTAWERLGEGF